MISGDRIKLRAVEPSDIPKLWEWMQDEETMRYRDYPAPPVSLAEMQKEYLDNLGHPSDRLRLAIITNNELIGEISLHNIDYRIGIADFTIAIGNKDYWGKGYGTDATSCLMKYAFEQLNLQRVTLYVHTFNERAIKVYEKCGFKLEGRMRKAHYMDGVYSDVLMMGLLREEFISVNGNPK
ncbi:MAG: GNAT family N-acetyltransferase [Armatimonadota bacterium]